MAHLDRGTNPKMIGQERASWQQFSEAFLARFGELDTDLIFDKFKKLHQVSTVEAYYDDFERCRGQLLKKILGLTNEYLLNTRTRIDYAGVNE